MTRVSISHFLQLLVIEATVESATLRYWCTTGTMDAQEEFDVLLEMDGSKRHLTVTCDTALTVVERELGNFDKDISILPLGERIADQTDRSKPVYVLQRWSSKFMTYIDVTDKTEFTDGTRLTVSLLSRENHLDSSSSCSSEVLYMYIVQYS